MTENNPSANLRKERPPVHDQLEFFIEQARKATPIRTAVVHPVDHNSLMGAIEAAEQGLIEPLLVGPEHKIRAAAEAEGIDLSPYEIVSTEHSHEAAERACGLVRSAEAVA